MVALLAEPRETFNLVLSQTRLLLLIVHLNHLCPRLQRQSRFQIQELLIHNIHQPQSQSLHHLLVAEDLLLVSVDKVEMLLLAVSVAMAIVTCDKPLAHKAPLHLATSKLEVTSAENPHNLHKMI
jgi:hypothetical protein